MEDKKLSFTRRYALPRSSEQLTACFTLSRSRKAIFISLTLQYENEPREARSTSSPSVTPKTAETKTSSSLTISLLCEKQHMKSVKTSTSPMHFEVTDSTALATLTALSCNECISPQKPRLMAKINSFSVSPSRIGPSQSPSAGDKEVINMPACSSKVLSSPFIIERLSIDSASIK